MRSPRSLVYTGVGLIFLVVLPFFLIASAHLKKHLPGNDCTVTNIFGTAAVQYQVEHILDQKSKSGNTYHQKSVWIPLHEGSKIGFGALIKTDEKSFVDIMIKNAAALRINATSLLKIEQLNKAPRIFNLTLNEGRVLSRVIATKASNLQAKPGGYQVKTPTATARVQGTTFAVDYFPPPKITKLAVLDGVVHFKTNDLRPFETRVHAGKKMQIAPSAPRPRLENITSDLRQELLEVQTLKIKATGLDRWNQTMDLVVASPFYNKALNIIADYEMKAFKRAIIYYARLCWDNTVPEKLQAVELEEGDYQDPWRTDYLYEKLTDTKAVLISAGPDKILHTQDDIFLAINL